MKPEIHEFLRQWRRWSLRALLISILINAPVVFMQWCAVSTWGCGGDSVVHLSLYSILLLMLVALTAPVWLILLGVNRTRKTAFFLLTTCVIYFAVTVVTMQISFQVRSSAFHALAKRSAVLVSAIKQYEIDHTGPPQTLAQLVPQYLPAIPQTGMAAYPDYVYVPRGLSDGFEGEPWPEGNTWILLVHTPSGGINFDMFLYFPAQNYPKQAYGSWLEHVEDWAYAHE
ncbi:MAG: hypothetical protein IT443_04780 [Phycisphaeraceae bacterium]|nr:hypothetical protein [Phycisphaeraceae bacterium]